MRFVDAKFNWDLGNTEKCQKHGLTIAEIEAFFSVDLMVFEDIRHSLHEKRLVAVGRGLDGRR